MAEIRHRIAREETEKGYYRLLEHVGDGDGSFECRIFECTLRTPHTVDDTSALRIDGLTMADRHTRIGRKLSQQSSIRQEIALSFCEVEQARLLIDQAEALGEAPEDPLLLFSVLFGSWLAALNAFDGDAVRS